MDDGEEKVRGESGGRGFAVSARALSVAAWLLPLGILVAVRRPPLYAEAIAVWGLGLLYQLIVAAALGNAFDGEWERGPRRTLAVLWCGSFAVMLLNLIAAVYFWERLMWISAMLTPLCCIVCGIGLMHYGHSFSGRFVFALAPVSWLSPLFMLYFVDFFS